MFTLIWEDKHVDTEVYLFDDFDNAYMFAKDACEDAYEDNGYIIDYTLTPTMRKVGWLFHAYSEDSFSMRIEEKQITPV
jgi:hypothetical protein